MFEATRREEFNHAKEKNKKKDWRIAVRERKKSHGEGATCIAKTKKGWGLEKARRRSIKKQKSFLLKRVLKDRFATAGRTIYPKKKES